MSNSPSMRKSLCVAIAAIALSGVAGQTFAAQASEAPVISVSTAGVDFTNRASVRDFYAHLRQAAASVCDSNSVNPRMSQEDQVCAKAALANAVQAVNQPALTAMLDGSSNRTRLATLN